MSLVAIHLLDRTSVLFVTRVVRCLWRDWEHRCIVDLTSADDTGALLEVAVVVVEMWAVVEARLVADALHVVESEEGRHESEVRPKLIWNHIETFYFESFQKKLGRIMKELLSSF